MERADIEMLLFRFAATYPAAAAPQPGTVEEWLLSSVGRGDRDVAFAAFALWKELEPWPPTLSQFVDACAEVTRERAASAAGVPCPHCDNGWVEVDVDAGVAVPFVQPCPVCRPAQYERFIGGHLVPGHECDVCRPKRKRMVKAAASADRPLSERMREVSASERVPMEYPAMPRGDR